MRTYLLFVLLFLFIGKLQAQSITSYTESGYTSLTIKLSGEYKGTPNISMLHVSNPLSHDRPTQFDLVNDSTMTLSLYTFGPTTVYFVVDQKLYLSTSLLPNHADFIRLQYQDSINYTISYQGHFKEIFDHSPRMRELIFNYFDLNRIGYERNKGLDGVFRTANAFRDIRLNDLNRILEDLGRDLEEVPNFKLFFLQGIENSFRTQLLTEYTKDLLTYNRRIGLDSAQGAQHIPERDITYLHGIITQKYADTSTLIGGSYYGLLSSIQNDPTIGLSNIAQVGAKAYLSKLKMIFEPDFPKQEGDLFYDMMLASAYIAQINQDQPLTIRQRNEVITQFENKHISNYILYQDDMTIRRINKFTSNGIHHLPFDTDKQAVLSAVLARYKDKVVVMDFWATWCGPCIEAHDRIKPVKEHYADRDDVVFVYLTNESSDYVKWKDYVSVLGGEHYYLYDAQHDAICDHYDITSIPSYLIFDKRGELSSSNLGGYMGNEKAVEWIEEALSVSN